MLSFIRTSRVTLSGASKARGRAYRPSFPRHDYSHSGFINKETLGYGALAGVAGGCAVLLGAYGYYHTSGLKKVVDTVRPAIAALKNSGSQLGQSHPVEAMRYLRQAAKAYVSYYPGAGYIVDKAFDGLDGIVEAHRADINDIIVRGQNSIRQVIERDGNEHSASSVLEVLAIIRRMLVEIKDLGQRAGAPIAERLELERRLNELGGSTAALFDGIAYKAPEIKAKLGEFAEYAKAKSPEVSAKMGEFAQSAKDNVGSKASSLYDGMKAQAPGIKETLSTTAEKAKNTMFPPEDN